MIRFLFRDQSNPLTVMKMTENCLPWPALLRSRSLCWNSRGGLLLKGVGSQVGGRAQFGERRAESPGLLLERVRRPGGKRVFHWLGKIENHWCTFFFPVRIMTIKYYKDEWFMPLNSELCTWSNNITNRTWNRGQCFWDVYGYLYVPIYQGENDNSSFSVDVLETMDITWS